MLPVLQTVFILLTSYKEEDCVVIIGSSKSRGTLALWPSQDADDTHRLVPLDYFLPLF